MTQAIICTKSGIHKWVRGIQWSFLVLVLIFVEVLQGLFSNYKAGESRMLFHNSRIIIEGLRQLLIGMIVGIGTLFLLNYAADYFQTRETLEVINPEERAMLESRSKTTFGSFCISLFLTISILVTGHTILFAATMALFNNSTTDQNEFQNIASQEEKEKMKSQHSFENVMLSFSLLLTLLNLVAELLRILVDVNFFMDENGYRIIKRCCCCKKKVSKKPELAQRPNEPNEELQRLADSGSNEPSRVQGEPVQGPLINA